MSSFPAEGHAKDIYTQRQPCASVVSAAHRSQHDSLGQEAADPPDPVPVPTLDFWVSRSKSAADSLTTAIRLGPSVYTSCIRRELGALEKQPSKTPSQANARQPQPPSRRRAESVTEPGALLARNSQSRAHAKPPQPVQPDSAVESIQLILLLILAVFLVPIIWVVLSSRSHGGAKPGWLVVVLLFSWLGFAVFLIVTQPSRNSPST